MAAFLDSDSVIANMWRHTGAKVFLLAAAGAAVQFASLFLIMTYVFSDWRGSEPDVALQTEVVSPDKKHIARHFIVSDGMVAEYVSHQVKIQDLNSESNRSAGIISSPSEVESLEWKENGDLMINYVGGGWLRYTSGIQK